MISEKDLSRGFQEFWSQMTPLLTPHYVHLFNESYRRPIFSSKGERGQPVEVRSRGSEAAIIAEIAFRTAAIRWQLGTDVEAVERGDRTLQDGMAKALEAISSYQHSELRMEFELTDERLEEIKELLLNYKLFLDTCNTAGTEFAPTIRGCGVLDTCEADISVTTTLYEVKTTTKSIAGRDIRQLLVYLALQAAAGERRWTKGGFLNPRRAFVYNFDVDEVVHHISGGTPAQLLFESIVDTFPAHDIQLDGVF